MIEDWIAADELELGDDGLYRLSATVSTKYDELLDRYVALVKDWNKFVGEYIAVIAPKDVGRPLAASDAQVAQVLKLRKEGTPYRLIVDETGLGLQTVRTIIGRKDRTDRTTKKRMERLGIDRTELIRAKARKRTRDALPRRIKETLDAGTALIKEARGYGKTR